MKTIKAEISVDDKFTQAFKKFGDGLDRIALQNEKTNKGLQKQAKTVDGLTDSVKSLVSAYVSWRTINMVKDLASLGAEAESVAQSFESLGNRLGFVATKLTDDMRTATDSMVDDMTLQRNAMKALISGIDPDDMLVAMQYVSRYANSVGADAEQLMQTVMTGLARGSAQFLDDVGIQVMGAEDVVGEAVDQMKKKMLEFNDNSFSNMRQFEAQMKNLRIELGKELVPAMDLTIANFKTLMGTIDDTEKSLDDIGDFVFNLTKYFNILLNTTMIAGNGIKGLAGSVGIAWSEIAKFSTSAILGILGAYDQLLTAINESGEVGDMLISDNSLVIMDDVIGKLEEWKVTVEGIGDSSRDMVAGAGEDIETLYNSLADIVTMQKKVNEAVSGNGGGGGGNPQAEAIREVTKRYFEQEKSIKVTSLTEKQLHDDKMSHWQEEEDRLRELLEREQEVRRSFASDMIQSAGDIISSFQDIHSSRMSQIQQQYDAESQAIRDSAMSAIGKEKALKKLEAERTKREIEAQKRQVAYTAIVGASNTALAIQQQILAILGAQKDTVGGALTRIASGVAMAGATAGYIAQIKSAQAQIPKREYGGAVRRGELYEVAERGKDELFESGGKTYLLPSQGGRVVPNNQISNSSNVNIYATFNGGDISTIEKRLPELVARGLEMADRQGKIDYGRMPNFNRVVGE